MQACCLQAPPTQGHPEKELCNEGRMRKEEVDDCDDGVTDAATVMKSAPRKKRSKGYHHNTFVQCISHTDGGLWTMAWRKESVWVNTLRSAVREKLSVQPAAIHPQQRGCVEI